MDEIIIAVEQMPHGEGLGLPAYATPGSSGMDLLAAVSEPVILEPGRVTAIPTALKVEIPVGLELQIRPRSGLALKHGVTCLNTPGTVDADYRGEIKVILANLGTEPFEVTRGMRIAQAVVAPVVKVQLKPVDRVGDTERGSGGFGSTGV